jgi:hypothetical protein
MASEILGLFGGQNPQQLRNAALDSMLVSPAQMGSQGLLQQVVSMGQNAGTVAGMGAGRLMGGKVAGEVEASYLEQAIQAGQAGKTPTEKMELVASFLEDKPGMGAQYMKALSEARRLKAEDFTMTQAKEKARTRTIKRQVDQIDPYTGKVIGQRSADITQVDSGKRDDKGNIVWEDLQQQDRTTQPAAAGTPSAQEQAKAALNKLNATSSATSSAPPADNTLGGVIDAAESRVNMAPLNREADIERAGYNSAAEQVAERDRKIKEMADVERLTPYFISIIMADDARRILRDRFEFLNDEQKRALRKRIAKGDAPPPRRPPAAPGDLSGSRLL